MKQDRFLTGILIGIALLIVAALAVFFTRQDKAQYVGQNTPSGVLHDYVLAIMNKDYARAYTYLADLDDKPTLNEFREAFAVGRLTPGTNGVKLGRENTIGDDATVEVSMVFSPDDPFSSGYSNVGTAQLIRQNGVWKIANMPAYNLWDYSWYQKK